MSGKTLRLGIGRPLPYGCSEGAGGSVNFSINAPASEQAFILIEGCGSLQLSASRHRTGSIWHCDVTLPFPAAGARYAWLIDPPESPDPEADDAKLRLRYIVDPCARVLDSPNAQAWNVRTAGKYAPSAVIPDFHAMRTFNWEGVESPGIPMKDLVIYEAHVRSFTRHPDSSIEHWDSQAGSFLGFIQKIPHLLRLGINCVELLPIFEFDETACPRKHPQTDKHLCNYWGYSTVAYYVPMQRFASRGKKDDQRAAQAAAAAVEFRTMVRELHRHGIEVILDVVFNHTGEGSWGESNWHSLMAVADSHYYLMSNGYHTNYTGCGNTVNANDPACVEWILDCLRFWALEMRVDGFRFDLAAAMCRGADGQITPDPLFVRRLTNDPLMSHVKLIAEPWDCSWPDGYLVGQFPSGGAVRWAEWNGKFRDTVRRFIKGDQGMKGDFATRICGSSDLYEKSGRGPCHSINFITAHDGFTLRDLVSYHEKQNAENAEESGEDNNNSWNCGVEGVTKNPEILLLRERQMRNFLVALFLSAGTPMMVSGDEYGRTQAGNNNTWCQDERNWFSWEDCLAEEAGLLRFMRLLISLRKQHSAVFASEDFSRSIEWTHDSWEDPYNYVSFLLRVPRPEAAASDVTSMASSPMKPQSSAVSDAGRSVVSEAGQSRAVSDGRSVVTSASGAGGAYKKTALLVAFNSGHEAFPCSLPLGRDWYRLIDTHLEAPLDMCDSDEDAQLITGESYLMTPYSCIVLKSCEDPMEVYRYDNIELECGSRVEQVAQELQRVAGRSLREELLGALDTYEEVKCDASSSPWAGRTAGGAQGRPMPDRALGA